MRYLAGIPCLYGPEHTKEAIDSIIDKEDVDVLIIDNGADASVKAMLEEYKDRLNLAIIQNPENIYVNPAWNQILEFFIKRPIYDYLLIMNSDLVLHKDWEDVLDKYLSRYPEIIPIPIISDDRNILKREIELKFDYTQVYEGTPGVLIILNKTHAQSIYPIPETIKVWFGDNWIYEGLRKLNYSTIVLNNLLSFHSGSQTVERVKGVSQIIEQDKIEWEKLK